MCDPQEATNNLIVRLERKCEEDRDIQRLKYQNLAFINIAETLRYCPTTFDASNEYHFPYLIVPDAIRLLLMEIHYPARDVKILVDGERGTYPEISKYFPQSSYVDSLETTLTRLSDHIAGLITRFIWALSNDSSRAESEMNNLDKLGKDKLRVLNSKWFEIDTFQLGAYHSLYCLLVASQKHYWSILTVSYDDGVSYFVSLLYYFYEFRTFSEYSKITPEQHKFRFETCAINQSNEIYRIRRNTDFQKMIYEL